MRGLRRHSGSRNSNERSADREIWGQVSPDFSALGPVKEQSAAVHLTARHLVLDSAPVKRGFMSYQDAGLLREQKDVAMKIREVNSLYEHHINSEVIIRVYK